MKKLFNGRFLFILVSSLVTLISLVIAAYFLFNDADSYFVKSGYVLNPLSANTEKYYFDKDTEYHENLSGMIVFNDNEDKGVDILKDSFLHYNDGSLSFLKNGAILDLDSVNGSDVVKIYNITSESIINRNNDGYTIENISGNVNLKKFIGRINDDKYIFVGNVSLKIPGNDTNIDAEYFEIVYIEEGIINIENDSVKYQVAADGTSIYVDNVEINLGNKVIKLNNNDVMSLTTITIDGDENVEIIPLEKKDDENKENNNSSDNGTTGTGNGSGNGTGNGTGDSTGDGNESGQDDKDGTTLSTSDELIVKLKDASVSNVEITTIFDIYNAKDDDEFVLKVVNLSTLTEIEINSPIVISGKEMYVGLLNPETRYLFTVINQKDGNKYFQKIFETNEIGIDLEKVYATDSELGFRVSFSEDTNATSAKLTLLKYNEETKKNEVVTSSYVDSKTGETVTREKIYTITNDGDSISGTHEIIFDSLDSNTIYTAVLNGIVISNGDFKDAYEIVLNTLTLKKTPSFSDMDVVTDVNSGTFKLSLGKINDEDNAIRNYTYLIYKRDEPNELAIDPITKTNASPIQVKVGTDDGELRSDVNYYYRVVIEYFDNEKYVEYTTEDTINFVMGSDPLITVVSNEDRISYDAIDANIYLVDNSCLVSIPGRKSCSAPNIISIDIVNVNNSLDTRTITVPLDDFVIEDDEVKYNLHVDRLLENTTYKITFRAYVGDSTSQVVVEHSENSEKTITTKSLSSFITEWTDNGSDEKHVINVNTKFIGKEGTGTMTPEETANAINKVVVKLYEGNSVINQNDLEPIKTVEYYNNSSFNIKEEFYDNGYQITSDGDFELSLDYFREKGIGTYTIMIDAYYDNNGSKGISLESNILEYTIPDRIFEVYADPEIEVIPIKNGKEDKIQSNLSNENTIVGYKVKGYIDSNLASEDYMPGNINFYVYDENGNKVSFYSDKNYTELVDMVSGELDEYQYIYIDYGSEYNDDVDIMSRGNNYYIGFEVEMDTPTGTKLYPSNSNENIPSEYGFYSEDGYIETIKEEPQIKSYISKTTVNSVTYKYYIYDPDKALYRESKNDNYGLYYFVNRLGEEKLDITSINDNEYSGSITISNLNKGDVYTLYCKNNLSSNEDVSLDIVNNYFNSSSSDKDRLFEGMYDVSNIQYEIINNQNTDNKVIIKLLGDSEVLNRVLSYKINFSAKISDNVETISSEFINLYSCSSLGLDDDDEFNRCISFDYSTFRKIDNSGNVLWNMKSSDIKVKITAYYDTGINGFDYVVGSSGDYPYAILQNNSTGNNIGSYLSVSNSKLVTWKENSNIVKGYYSFSIDNDNKVLIEGTDNIYKLMNIQYGELDKIRLSLSNNGYQLSSSGLYVDDKSVNVKMVNGDDIAAKDGNDTFSFGSYTPKIKVNEITSLINGSVKKIVLSGADFDDFKDESGKNYLYIDVFDDEEMSVRSRSTIKVPISDNTVNAVIDGLPYNEEEGELKKYYFAVYAYLYDSSIKDYTYRRLFDVGTSSSEYGYKLYSLTPLKVSEIYSNRSINLVSDKLTDNNEYDGRYLEITYNFIPYRDWELNYGLTYIMCKDDVDVSLCSLSNEDSYYFKVEVSEDDISKSVSKKIDISEYNLEYDKNYVIKGYAIASYYDNNNNIETVQNIYLGDDERSIYHLRALKEPEFIIERKAVITDDNKYAIDIDITVVDSDKTLVGSVLDGTLAVSDDKGKYFIKVMDGSSNIVGKLQVLDDDGNYVDAVYSGDDYSNYALEVLKSAKHIRITNLDKNTKYSISVYGNAFMNNYSEDTTVNERTYMIEKTIEKTYTTDEYGVAFGEETNVYATENSFIVIFPGGSNLKNKIIETQYDIYDASNTSRLVYSGTIDSESHNWTYDSDGNYWALTLVNDISNESGQLYNATVQFTISITRTELNEDNEEVTVYDTVTRRFVRENVGWFEDIN